MKKSKNIVLIVTPVLSAALLNACGSSRQPYPLANTTTPASTPNPVSTAPAQTAQTRDVYNNLDECVKDWLDKELCEQMSEDDDRDYRTRYRTTRTGRFFYGPRYSSSDRIIVYKGKTITPTGKVTTKMPTFTSSVPSSKTSSTTTSTTKSSTLPSSSSTTKSTTSSSSSTSSSSTTNPYSSSSSSSTSPYSSSSSSTSPYSSSSSTTRGGFGSTSSSSSSSYSSSSRSSSGS